MQMQFHALFRRIVHHLELFHRGNPLGAQHNLAVVLIILHIAAHQDGHPLFQRIQHFALGDEFNDF